MSTIDRMLLEAAGGATPHCFCAACRRRREAPSAAGLILPEWRGWSPRIAWADVLKVADLMNAHLLDNKGKAGNFQAAARAANAAIRRPLPKPFFTRGTHLYRFSRAGQTRPIDIGQTTRPLVQRLFTHAHPSGTIRGKTIAAALRSKPRSRAMSLRDKIMGPGGGPRPGITVQYGRFSRPLLFRGRRDLRYLHAFECALQRQELAETYRHDTVTFDD